MRGPNDNRTIDEFFARVKPAAPSSSNTAPGSAPILPGARTAATRKAGSGIQSEVDLSARTAKRVKREASGDDGLKKRERGAKTRGKLSLLPSLPLDILFEIFKLLAPTDILALSRTTKAIRAVLLHPSAVTVWMETLKQMEDFPKRPDDVSLPFWTALNFDTFCHNCLARNTSSVNFILRVRWCNKCAKSGLIPLSSYPRVKETLSVSVPCDFWNDGSELHALRTDVDAFLVKWKVRILGETETQFAPERAAAAQRKLEGTQARAWHDKRGDERLKELSKIRSERAKAMRQKLKDLGWEEELTFLLRFYDVCLISPPPYGISFSQHPLVKQTKPLTERTWKNIEPDMIAFMTKMREYKKQNDRIILERERRKVIQRLYLTWRNQPAVLRCYPASHMTPGPLDVLEDETIKSLVALPDDVAIENFTTHAERVLRDHLPSIVRLYRRARNKVFHHMIDNKSSSDDFVAFYRALRSGYSSSATHAQFRQAAVVFRCTSSRHEWVDWALARDQGTAVLDHGRWTRAGAAPEPLLWYPEFLTHPCCSLQWPFYHDIHKPEANFSLCGLYDGRSLYQQPWSDKTLEFDQVASRNVLRILKACDMDADVTVDELNARDPRLVCMRCTFGAKCDGERTVNVWGWREAVNHSISKHFGNSVVEWECLSDEDTAEAKRLESIERVKNNFPTPATEKVWRCTACQHTAKDKGRMTLESLRNHFTRKPEHGKADDMDAGLNQQYFRDTEASYRPLPRVTMIPKKQSPGTSSEDQDD